MDTVNETIREIKRQFRLFMNGTAAASMREKGLEYKVNWGIALPDLRLLAAKYDKSAALAGALWKEKSRECRILATLLMPPKEMTVATACEWTAEADTQELCELLAFNLLQYADCANELALAPCFATTGNGLLVWLNLLSRLLSRGVVSQSDVKEHMRMEIEKLQLDNRIAIAHAACNCCSRLQ